MQYYMRLVAAGLCVVLAACGMDTSEQPGEQVLRVRLSGDPPTSDPAHGTDSFSGFIQASIFEPLVKYHPTTLELMPGVAESWQISEDSTTYTFHLRKGVKFHNGREVTSEDFRYSFERMVDPATKAERAWVVDLIAGSKEFATGQNEHIAGIETPDPYTLILRTDEPISILLPRLAMHNAGPVPREEVEKWGEEFSNHPVGCGPFKFVSWTHDAEVVLEAFEDYYGGKPRIPQVQFRILPDDTVARLEYKTGGLDLVNPLPQGQLRSIEEEFPGEVDVRPILSTYFLSFNLEHEPFKGNKTLRQAFNYAINKRKICTDLTEGRCVPANGILPPGMPGFNENLIGYPYDLEKAKRLLAQAGYPNGQGLSPITLWYNTSQGHQAICEFVQGELSKIGVPITLKNIEWAAYLKAVEAGEASFFRTGWIADYPDPETFLFTKLHSSMIEAQGTDNESRYRNPEFDALLDRAQTMVNLEDRIPLYREAERIAVEDAPWLFIYYYGEAVLVKPRVGGFSHSAWEYFMTPLAEMWIEEQ